MFRLGLLKYFNEIIKQEGIKTIWESVSEVKKIFYRLMNAVFWKQVYEKAHENQLNWLFLRILADVMKER